MDQFEDTVVNPNISLKNFEVKVREPENKKESHRVFVSQANKEEPRKKIKSLYLLALLTSILIYQVTIGI